MSAIGIICYWKFTSDDHDKWKLFESFAIDDDGKCLTTPSTGGGDRQEWHKWTNDKVYRNDEGEEFTEDEVRETNGNCDDMEMDWMPVMNRAVTIWTVEEGIRLLDFHGSEFPSWLGPEFYVNLRQNPKWASLVASGHELHFGTLKEALKYLTIAEDKK